MNTLAYSLYLEDHSAYPADEIGSRVTPHAAIPRHAKIGVDQ